MKDELVTFETAKLAREKGFDISTEWMFQYTDEFINRVNLPRYYASGCYTAHQPTQSLLQKWLREKHKISIEIGMHLFNKWYFGVQLVDSPMEKYPKIAKDLKWDCNNYNTYEQALEAGLYEALKLIK